MRFLRNGLRLRLQSGWFRKSGLLTNKFPTSGLRRKLKNSPANKALRSLPSGKFGLALIIGQSFFSTICVLKVGSTSVRNVRKLNWAVFSPFGRKESGSRPLMDTSQGVARKFPSVRVIVHWGLKSRSNQSTMGVCFMKKLQTDSNSSRSNGNIVGLKNKSEPCLITGTSHSPC